MAEEIKKPEEKKPENPRILALQQALSHKIDWNSYDKGVTPDVDVDLSICTAEERPRMVAIVNRLAKSEKGRETLEIAAKGGFKFGFLVTADRSFGTCFPSNKKIGLNPNASDSKLVGTLCHEARHAGQAIRDTDKSFSRDILDVASILRTSRAKEADAQVYAVLACEELKRQGDAEPAEQFKLFYPPIDKAFSEALEKNNGQIDKRLMMETFKGWYDQDSTKASYEENYILKPMNVTLSEYDQGKKKEIYTFKKSTSAEKTAELIGWTKGGSYFVEPPQLLNEEKFIGVCERTMADMKIFFEKRQQMTGIAPDKSIESLPVHKDVFPRRRPLMGDKEPETAENKAPYDAIKKWSSTQRKHTIAMKKALAAKGR